MRVLLIAVAVAVGCSRQPDLTPEQRAALQMIGEQNSPDGQRLEAAFQAASSKQPPRPPDDGQIRFDPPSLDVRAALVKEMQRRVAKDGTKKTADWMEGEAKKTWEQLNHDWVTNPPVQP